MKLIINMKIPLSRLYIALTLLLSAGVSRAIELHVPVAPPSGTYIIDYGKIFNAEDMGLPDASLGLQKAKENRVVYIMSVPEDYAPHLDVYADQVARSWDICGDEGSALLLISRGQKSAGIL